MLVESVIVDKIVKADQKVSDKADEKQKESRLRRHTTEKIPLL